MNSISTKIGGNGMASPGKRMKSYPVSKSFDDAVGLCDDGETEPARKTKDPEKRGQGEGKEGKKPNHVKRMQRRLSAGTMSCGSAYSSNYNSADSLDVDDVVDALFSRRSSNSSTTSYNNLSNDGSSDVDGVTSIEDLKERSKKNLKPKKRRSSRRSSLSSIHSSTSSQASSQSIQLELSTELSLRNVFSNNEGAGVSEVDFAEAGHASIETLPITNVVELCESPKSPKKPKKKMKGRTSVRKDRIIESLVWFSFHIPRTVLEDLIAHELEVWKSEHSNLLQKSNSRSGLSKRNRKGMKSLPTISGHGANEEDDEGSLSSLSDEGEGGKSQVFASSFSEDLIMREGSKIGSAIKLPKAFDRQAAILFVDMSGFTKLSTVLDVESLSKVINSYFDMIVSDVINHGGDILKFAGDAFFAEWRVVENKEGDDEPNQSRKSNPLSDLNASLVSINEMCWDDNDDVPPISNCVMMASKCASSIVKKFSDYRVTAAVNRGSTSEAMLNVHCGVGVGSLVGLHVGDYKEGEEEDAVELRREFLLLGEPIDQVSQAADKASDGEVYASPEAILSLAMCCKLTDEQFGATEPVLIASRDESYLRYDVGMEDAPENHAMQPYESLRMHCRSLNHAALQRLNLQMALYVHPVIRQDELALLAAIQGGKISQPTETLESRHRAEAELRSVYTMFITPIITPHVTGVKFVDDQLYATLGNVMHVTSRELDRYSGHLRQFIVDDKGVVLIATFGLRGSTFPNMVENNCLPATFAIHRALKDELNVDNRVGATFGKVYCGVVGAVRRHEFACMGAPVNLAARLMSSKVNEGILVDEAVCEQCREGYTFKSLPPVKAKGYAKPVSIFQPIPKSAKTKHKKSTIAFTGRKVEKRAILSVAQSLLEEPEISQSSICFLSGESGSGKSSLALTVLEELRKKSTDEGRTIITARSSSTETEQRIPLR